MGAIFLLQYSLFNQYLCRVDARVTTNKEGRSPIEIAQNKGFTEIVVLLSESIGEELLELEEGSAEAFREQLEVQLLFLP